MNNNKNDCVAPNDKDEVILNESDFSNFYVNSANLVFGYFDFQFIFSHQSPLIIKEGVVANNIVRITMSPQHVKIFSKILEQNVREYEKTFGEIEVKDDYSKSLNIEKKKEGS